MGGKTIKGELCEAKKKKNRKKGTITKARMLKRTGINAEIITIKAA